MSERQTQGATLFLLGVALLILSVGVAWTLSRVSRRRRVEVAWVITVLSFVLFVAGVVLWWFGVSAMVES
jgi:hypothetical protein